MGWNNYGIYFDYSDLANKSGIFLDRPDCLAILISISLFLEPELSTWPGVKLPASPNVNTQPLIYCKGYVILVSAWKCIINKQAHRSKCQLSLKWMVGMNSVT